MELISWKLILIVKAKYSHHILQDNLKFTLNWNQNDSKYLQGVNTANAICIHNLKKFL